MTKVVLTIRGMPLTDAIYDSVNEVSAAWLVEMYNPYFPLFPLRLIYSLR